MTVILNGAVTSSINKMTMTVANTAMMYRSGTLFLKIFSITKFMPRAIALNAETM